MKDRILQNKLAQSLSQFYDHIAVQYNNRFLSYGELDKRSNHTAQWIIKKGIEKETFIGVLIDDKIKLIVTMIGILKAGCVFIPLDTAFPADRLKVMIESTDTKFIITDIVGFNDFLAGGNPGTIEVQNQDVEFCLLDDIFAGRESSWYIDRPAVQYSPEDKIYVYFTSGTTGTPKAIIGRNKGLLHFINWEIDTFAIDDTFRFSQFTNPGFDAFLRDILVPLCSGGVICIPPDRDVLLDSTGLIDWVNGTGINLIHCVPSLFRLFNSNPGSLTNHHFKNLKFILLSGEPIRPTDLVHWYETFDERIRLVNLWGTSETTLAKTCYFIRKSDAQKERIPVGKPIRGAMVIVLNENMKICKPMVVGDIYIRTPYRTHGYYNDPELNKARFIPNPFVTDPGDLLHKTGDLGRLLPDDNIEFLGRSDRQVKIRGIRIELEEIESTLLTHPSVKEAVVVKREFSNHNELLCAYINAKDQVIGIKEYLSEKLPDYMVPAHVTKLEEIPRTPSGKVDFTHLPDPLEKEVDYIPPGDVIEKKLQELWSEILGLEKEKISVNHHFFLLGGNSLNIMSLISKIHKELDIRIPLGEIFYHPTIQTQAEIIKKSTKEKFIPINPSEEKEYYPLSSSQKRMYVAHLLETESKSYNIPSIMVIEGEMDPSILDRAFRGLIKRHDSLRTSFITVDDEPVQKIHPGVTFNVDFYEAGHEESQKIVENFIRPFDLTRAPLLRAGVIKTDENRYILMVDMYHIISDAVSYDVLVKEFKTFYNGMELPPLRLQYKDFSEWQGELAASEKMRQQEKFWLQQFEGEIPVLNLPQDYPRPDEQSFVGDKYYFELDTSLKEAINELELETGSTLNIVLLAVYIVLLSKYSEQEDIVVGFGIAGRTHADLENVVGMFVNMMAIRNRPSGNLSFTRFVEEVKENSLKTYENQDYQFEELVRKLGIKRHANRNPLFDAVFNFRDQSTTTAATTEAANPSGLKVKNHGVKIDNIQFDLVLTGIRFNRKVGMMVEYLTALFKPSTIRQVAKNYIEILEQLAKNKNIKLKDLTISHELSPGVSTLSREEASDFNF